MTIGLGPDIAAAFLLLFARLGALVMTMPALGERGIPARIRLSIGLILTLVLYPIVKPNVAPLIGAGVGAIGLAVIVEVAVGLVVGIAGRIAVASVQTAGAVIAQQIGLGFVQAIDPTQGAQSAIFANFLAVTGLALIFATDLHHLVILGLVESYRIFPAGALPDTADTAAFIVGAVSGSFKAAIQISAPFLAFALLFNVGLGLVNRMMPQMQVFFVGTPLAILLGFVLLAAVIAGMMTAYLGQIEAYLGALAGRR